MKAVTRQVNDVTIVDLSGQIKLGEGSSVVRDTVKDLLGKGQKKILLNLGDINYIDSSGIGELVSAFTSVRNQGGELKLLHLTKKVHDLLQMGSGATGRVGENCRTRRRSPAGTSDQGSPWRSDPSATLGWTAGPVLG